MNLHRLSTATLTLCLAACAANTTSSVEGNVVASSFATTPEALTATDETGAATDIALLASGAFYAKLQSGHTYSLTVNTAGGTVPLLFPRANGQLDATFFISSPDAVIALGSIQALNSMPANGIPVSSAALLTTDPDAGVAVDDTQTTTCAPSHDHQNDGGCPGMGGTSRHRGGGRPDRKSNSDGGLAVKPAQGNPSAPFCYPATNPPAAVDCSGSTASTPSGG